MASIFWKEFKMYFITPFGYIYIGLFLLIAGVVFAIYNLMGAKSDINGMFGVLNFASILIFPVLTMKLIADEKKIGTDKLLFTAPIKIVSIVLGKYLSALIVFIICVVLTMVFPIFLIIFGNVSTGAITSAYLGFILLGASYIAICLFASSITDNQVTSAILGFGFLIFFILSGFISDYIPYVFIRDLLGTISLSNKFEVFSTGILKIETFIYYFSFITVFLILTVFAVNQKYLNIKINLFKSGFKKYFKLKDNLSSLIKFIIFILIIILINILSAKIPFVYDMTSDKIFTLSEKTKNIVKNLDKDINIVIFNKNGINDKMLGSLLDEYLKIGNNKIKYQFVDADKNPDIAGKYDSNNEGISNGMIIIECNGKIKKLHDFDIVKPDSSGIGQSFNGEQQITGAIQTLITGKLNKLYFLEGHRELNVNNDLFKLKNKLETESYMISNLNLLVTNSIPKDTDAIIVISPKSDLNSFELKILKEYLEKGGRMIFLFDVLTSKTDIANFNILLNEYGAKINNNYIIEESLNNIYTNNKMLILPLFVKHEIIDKIQSSGLSILLPFPGNIEIINKKNEIKIEPVLLSTEKSWIRYDINNMTPSKTSSDKDGPAIISIVITKDNSSQKYLETKISIIYNSRFLFDNVIDIQGNYDFFINTLNWVEGKKDSISIRPKMLDANNLNVKGSQFIFLIIFSILLYPLIIFVIGYVVWIKRKDL